MSVQQTSQKKAAKAARDASKYWKKWHLTWNVLSLVAVAAAYFENKLVASQEMVDNKTYYWFLAVYFAYLLIVTVIGQFTNGRLHNYNGHFAQLNISLGVVLIIQDLLTEKFAVLEQCKRHP